MDEARRGEELGFGTGFISERWNVKEASSLEIAGDDRPASVAARSPYFRTLLRPRTALPG